MSGTNQINKNDLNFIRQQSKNDIIVISFVTKEYLPIARNWAAGMKRLNISNYAIICFDSKSSETLQSEKIPCIYPSDLKIKRTHPLLYRIKKGLGLKVKKVEEKAFSVLWKKRMGFILSLLENGLNVILSDLDAVWLRNPIPDYINNHKSQYDIISSIVEHKNAYPRKMREAFGITFCMGFVFWKNSAASIRQLAKVYQLMNENNSVDQREFNHLILDQNPHLTALKNGDFEIKTDNVNILGLESKVINRGKNLDGVYVCHPNSGKTPEETLKILKEENLWFLNTASEHI